MTVTVFGSDHSVDLCPTIEKIYQTLKTVFCHIFNTFKFLNKKIPRASYFKISSRCFEMSVRQDLKV